MMQKELQKEFKYLIKEISKEVLEINVVKSLEKASYTVKDQVPALSKNIDQLKFVLNDLQKINSQNVKHQQETSERENRIETKLKTIDQKVDSEIKKLNDFQKNLSSFQNETSSNFNGTVSSLERTINSNSATVNQQLTSLSSVTNEKATELKKLLIWILVFSVGSFGVLSTILLNTLKVIAL